MSQKESCLSGWFGQLDLFISISRVVNVYLVDGQLI